jgi:hypothetical protein
MSTGNSRIRITPSNGVRLSVWRRDGLFRVAREDEEAEPQVCLGVDLFEVIAELAGLDLESADGAEEATKLADRVQDEVARSEGG